MSLENGSLTRALSLATLCMGVTWTAVALAEDDSPGPRPPSTAMRVNVPLDVAVTATATATWVALELLKAEFATRCRWCDRNANGTSSLNGFDAATREALRWADAKSADTLSTIFSFGLAPAAGIAVGSLVANYDHRLDELPLDLLVVAEAGALAMDLNQVSKFAFARERPNVHARNEADRQASRTSGDNLSFFSGHATLAFSLATAAGTIASMRHYRLAPAMWVSGLILASTGAYLRIAADQHYATDVLTGAVVGSGMGFAVPYFARGPGGSPGAVQVLPLRVGDASGVMLVGAF